MLCAILTRAIDRDKKELQCEVELTCQNSIYSTTTISPLPLPLPPAFVLSQAQSRLRPSELAPPPINAWITESLPGPGASTQHRCPSCSDPPREVGQ